MTTESTTGLNPKTIQKLRDEFREQFSELINSSNKGWPACLPAGGGPPQTARSAHSPTDTASRPPTPLYFNWTDDGIPPPPPGYTPVSLETGVKDSSEHIEEEVEKQDDFQEDESDQNSDEETFHKSVATSVPSSRAGSSRSCRSGRRYNPPPRSNVFNFGSSTSSVIDERRKKFENCQGIAGCTMHKPKDKPQFPDVHDIVDRYASNRSVNSYLKEHVAFDWAENAKSKEFGSWLKGQKCLWNAFASSKPDQVYTVLRLYTHQLPVGFSVGTAFTPAKSPIRKSNPKSIPTPIVKKEEISCQEDDTNESHYDSDSILTEESESDFGSSKDSFQDSIQPQKEKLSALVAAREDRRAGRQHASKPTSECSEDTKSEWSENRSPSNKLPSKSTLMKPTAASLNRTNVPHKFKKAEPTTMNTSLRVSRPIQPKPVVSKWAKKSTKLKEAKENQRKYPLVEKSPLLRNRRFGEVPTGKSKTEHQTKFGWKN